MSHFLLSQPVASCPCRLEWACCWGCCCWMMKLCGEERWAQVQVEEKGFRHGRLKVGSASETSEHGTMVCINS